MKGIYYVIIAFLVLFLSSCEIHQKEIDDAITNLEWVDAKLDSIGEKSIPGYRTSIYFPGINDNEHCDSITISEKEYREIQGDIYSVIRDLEELSAAITKEYETD